MESLPAASTSPLQICRLRRVGQSAYVGAGNAGIALRTYDSRRAAAQLGRCATGLQPGLSLSASNASDLISGAGVKPAGYTASGFDSRRKDRFAYNSRLAGIDYYDSRRANQMSAATDYAARHDAVTT